MSYRDYNRLTSLDSFEGIVAMPESGSIPQVLANVPGATLINAVYPGFLTALTIGLASTFLSQHYGAPVMLFALLFGMAFHFLHEEGRCVPGIEFSSRTILRIGVALLGARITVMQISSLGIGPILMVIVGVSSTIFLGGWLGKRIGLGGMFGILSGGAVAICGASAALAIASVLPRHEQSERDTILTVVAVTALSTLAMILYPVLSTWIGLDHIKAGIFLGGTIHDVAQVIGAGFMISPETGDIATYVKLLRVAMLLPVVSVIAWMIKRRNMGQEETQSPPVPVFLIGFAILVLISSTGVIPNWGVEVASTLSRWCLVTAIAALGMKTSFKSLIVVGWRPVGLMIVETIWILLVALIAVSGII